MTRPFALAALCLPLILSWAALGQAPAWAADRIRELQLASFANRTEKAARAFHFGSQGAGDVFSNFAGHTNRLIPVYVFGRKADLGSVTGANSPYRDPLKVKALYGFLPEHTVNPDAEYADQSDCHRVLNDAVGHGARHLFIVWFDGMDWETTRAAAIVRSGKLYTEGKGSGLVFQDYEAGGSARFGWFVTSPTHDWKPTDVDGGKPPTWLGGGYDARIAGANPWAIGPLGKKAPGYIKGQEAGEAEKKAVVEAGGVPHACTDSAPSAAEFASGVKSYNHGLNVNEAGQPVPTLFNRLQKDKGWKVGTVTSVPFNHASPAAFYAHNVHRDDFQDIARDMLGLSGIAQEKLKDPAHAGLDVVLGTGFGREATAAELAKQGTNAVKGNLYITEDDLEKIDIRDGGKYVVAKRTSGVVGADRLKDAAQEAARDGHRLFGFYGGTVRDNLPYRTADGHHDPVRGIRFPADTYTPADLRENPTLAQMTTAALTVLAVDPKASFALFVESGDVDFALHDNNLDNAIGAVLSGEEAVQVIIDWVEKHSNWDESVLIVTADHGHYLVIDDPKALTGH